MRVKVIFSFLSSPAWVAMREESRTSPSQMVSNLRHNATMRLVGNNNCFSSTWLWLWWVVPSFRTWESAWCLFVVVVVVWCEDEAAKWLRDFSRKRLDRRRGCVIMTWDELLLVDIIIEEEDEKEEEENPTFDSRPGCCGCCCCWWDLWTLAALERMASNTSSTATWGSRWLELGSS